MGKKTLDKAMAAEASKVPQNLLKQKITAKLTGAGIECDDDLAEAITEHFWSGATTPFQGEFPSGDDRSLSLEINDDDLQDIRGALAEFQKGYPQLVETFAQDAAAEALNSLKQQWFESRREGDLTRSDFENGINRHWGHAIDLLWMLLELCRQHGNDFSARAHRSRKERHLREALVLLHARGCQVAGEIIILMVGGYADGALARWRTLHEINMTALFLTGHGDDLAERYLHHAVVEAYDAMEEFLRTYELLGYARPSKRSIARVKGAYDKAIKKYGKSFGARYGWAKGYLKKGGAGFRQIEEDAGQAAMRSHYKMACYSVHAGAKSVAFRLGIETPGIHIAGASDSGLEEPGQNLAHTLTQLTAMVLGSNWGVDEMVKAHTLAALRDEISESLSTTESRIRRERTMIQKAIESYTDNQ